MASTRLSISNPRPQKLPGPQLLHELVPREGENGVVAIEYTSENGITTCLDYGELHNRADALARCIRSSLRRLASTPTRIIVPVLIPQCPELYVSQLASLKAGGAFCPIVLDVPEDRLRFILQDIDARCLLTTSSFIPKLPNLEGIEIIAVDQIPSTETESSTSAISIKPEDPAYIMYTSGSTGKPKGVVLSHSAATQALLAHDRHIPPFSRFLQFASPTFDVSVFEIFFPWLRKRTLVVCDRRRMLNDLSAMIRDLHVDACELTPSVASSLLRRRKDVPDLKLLLTIGEMLKPAVVEEFGGDSEESSILYGMYGPTEATIHCTLQTSFPKNMPCGVIGVPLDTVSAFVVKPVDTNDASPTLEIVPVGEEGELAVGGHQLADGYLNRDEQTRAVFVQHSEFGTLYRTGDRVRMSPDGVLECLGRISNGQVKLRGQRIELGEIEHAASRTASCRDAAAEVISGNLVVFCARDDQSLSRSSILETCQRWLPAFMVPGDVVVLDHLPYLASGKCDRKTLRAQYQQQATEEHSSSSPVNIDDQTAGITRVISRVLNATLTPSSFLPAYGLDSISSIRIASELQRDGLGRCDATHILAARTIADIATTSRSLETSGSCSAGQSKADSMYREALDEEIRTLLPEDILREVEITYPSTPVQTAMLAETNKRHDAYCNWVELHIGQSYDLETICEALHKLSAAHPLLRSGFVPVSNPRFQFAVVTWKTILPSQLSHTTKLKYDFSIECEQDLLRPCRFQVAQCADGHAILMQVHHALFDQWSLDILQVDLSNFLRAGDSKEVHSFQSVSDYYLEQQEETQSAESFDFWQNHLRQATIMTLPLLRDTVVPDSIQRSQWYETSLETRAVRARCQEMNCSMPALFQAALSYILGSYTGSSDVMIGTVFSGRTIPVADVDSVFGPCLVTLPFRMDYSTLRSCKELLTAAMQQNRALQRHVLTPPTVIRKAAGVLPGASLFDALFVWQESTVDMSSAQHCRVVDSADDLEFNLVLECVPSPDGRVKLRATFQQRLISPEQVNILLRQINTLASQMVASPDQDVKNLPSHLAPELLSISNPKPKRYADDLDILSAIDKQAFDQPSATAITFAMDMDGPAPMTLSISYRDLVSRANQMANHFRAAGLQPGELVCICMEKSIDLYVAMLATFKAGAGYLPLVPETPDARVKSVLSQTDTSLCLCDQASSAKLRELVDIKVVDLTSHDFSANSTNPPSIEQDGSRIAYAVFTSGSTGEPKGVAVTMDSLKGNLATLAELYDVQPGSRLLQSCSQAFDVSVFEIFFTFSQGMCLCSATKETMFLDFERSIRMLGATHLSLTPTVAALVKPENVPSVRFLVTAGEGITDNVHRTWAGHGLHDGYGPSETTNVCSVKMNVSRDDVLGNIGPPLRNTSAFVLEPNQSFKIAPAGAYGEFAFGGEQVFRGYIGREALNKVKIVQHPEYGRIYRTGDMGRILPDGTLLIAGRLDDQVKIRGNRVELGEINAMILRRSEILECTTLLLGEDASQQTLISFCVPASQETTKDTQSSVLESAESITRDLFDLLESSLPAYMVPSFVVPLRRLPITSQGKLDKRALKSTFENLDESSRNRFSRSLEDVAADGPANDFEHKLAEVLAGVLQIHPANISRNSSFFGLGLNSLNAIQFSKRVENEIGMKVGIAAILQNPSIARLSSKLSKVSNSGKTRGGTNVRDTIPYEVQRHLRDKFGEDSIEAILPCTPLQQAMLSASQSQQGASYSNTTRLEFTGDMDKLAECWAEMTRRHSILRTSFVETTSAAQPYAQVVFKDLPSTWHIVRGSKTAKLANGQINGHQRGSGNGYIHKKATLQAITLEHPVRIDCMESELYLKMHHAIYDGAAISNLLGEMSALYKGDHLPSPVPFEPFLHEMLAQNTDEAYRFWSQRMQGFVPKQFSPQLHTTEDKELSVRSTLPITQKDLDAFAERNACTNLSVFQAVWAKTLACVQNDSDVCFGNVVSGRTVPVSDVERLIAPCFNTIPVRVQVDPIGSNHDLIRRLHKDNLEAIPFQLTSPRRIQTFSQDPSKHLFDSLLLVQPPSTSTMIKAIEEDEMAMGIPLVLELTPREGTLDLSVHYMPANVSTELVSLLVDAFVGSLRSCLHYPLSSTEDFVNFDRSTIASQLAPQQPTSRINGEGLGEGHVDDSWTDEEALVRRVFADLAQIDPARIGKDTSLYQIGLDSLNAVQVASKLRSEGWKTDAADVMQYQSPASLARLISSTHGMAADSKTTVDLAAFDRSHRAGILQHHGLSEATLQSIRPATPTQSGMLAQFLQSQGSHYLNHSLYEVPEGYTVSDIRKAWSIVEKKHQVLRMGFCQLEEAASPFAMLIFKSGMLLSEVFTQDSDRDPNTVSNEVARDILNRIHLPVWRVSFFNLGQRTQMQLSLHHALYDADSLLLLLNDFARALHGESIGQAADLDPTLAIQLEGALSNQTERQSFWEKSLSTTSPVRFPSLTSTIVTSKTAGFVALDSEIAADTIDAFCRREGLTIQALGESVWAMLLAAYVGETGVTFGTVFSGATSQPVAFPTIATVPVFCDTNKSAMDVVRDMVAYNASVQRYRFTPLSEIQRYANSTGRALFDTIFVYQKSASDKEDAFNWQLVEGMLGVDYSVSMELEVPNTGTAKLRLTFDNGVIPGAHASLMLKQYESIMHDIVNEPSRDGVTRTNLMSYTPPKVAEIACPVRLLHELVESGARTHPHKVALEFIDELDHAGKSRRRWTYEQLDQRSNQVAHLISQCGVQPGSVVAVCMSKSAEASFAFVGILKAGCAFLAMDPELPLARRKFIIEDSQSKLLFVTPGTLDSDMQAVVEVVELEESALLSLPKTRLDVEPRDPSATSYCLYTSGTTGMPKGCELTHENAVQAMMAFQRLFAGHWTEASRWLQFASYWFDVSVLEQFWSWSVGITVVGAPRDIVLEDLAAFIREANITHIDLTPSLARLLAPEDVPSLWNHVFITGGEALKQEIIDKWGPYKTICNGYGPTEATIGVTMNPFIGADARPSNIGPAFDNVGAYVFKPGTDQLVLRGAVGELCVSGKLVGKGYLNRPDLTAKAFPFLERYGERVYRTGDLVRLLADGTVSFIGRADTQAKLRGQRLEIDEIDAVIKAADASISEAASLVIKSNDGNREMLASFIVDATVRNREVEVVSSDRSRNLVQAADQACQSKLPGYMVPTHIIPITTLPLTVNNKVDTKRLVSLFNSMTMADLQKLKRTRSEDREMTQDELKVVSVLSRLLNISRDDINLSSNVFSLGLSSVSAINFASMLKRSGFLSASVVVVMNNTSIDRLALALSSNSQAKEEEDAVKQAQLHISAFAHRHRNTVARALDVEASDIDRIAPCTPLQAGLLTESLKSTTRPYFNHFWYKVLDVDVQELETAIRKLYRTTPILRTLFVRTDEGFVQALTRSNRCPVTATTAEEEDFRHIFGQRKLRWSSEVDTEFIQPFEAVIVRSNGETMLAMHAHHAIYDGISWDLTMQQLAELCKSPKSVKVSPAFMDVLPYGPLCLRPDASDFWRANLSDISFMPFSTTGKASGQATSVQAKLADLQPLDAVRRELGVSHQALFQTAFAVALQHHSKQSITFGVVLSGRSINFDKAEQILGPMFNTVPFKIDRRSTDNWSALLSRYHEANAKVLPFQHTALRDIRKFCGRPATDPMFDVLFVFQQPTPSSVADRVFQPIDDPLPAEYPLAFEVELLGSGDISVTAASQQGFADTSSLQELIDSFKSALDVIVKDVHQSISDQFDYTGSNSHPDPAEYIQSTPDLNGVHDFEWTSNANLLRHNIAELVGCELDDVTEHSTIFTLGLDSIDAVKLGSRLKRAGLTLPVSKILQAQTIPRMLQAVQDAGTATSQLATKSKLAKLESELQGLRKDLPKTVERVLPATPGQEALLAPMIRSEFHQYFNSDILRLRPDVDLEKLKRAWKAVIDASPILRTSFIEVSDPDSEVAFAQVVHRPGTLSMAEFYVNGKVDLESYLERVRKDVKDSFAEESPLRLAVATSQTEQFLIFSLAHAQYDGHSIGLLHQDVASAYAGSKVSRPPYDEVIDMALDATNSEALSFWRNALAGAKVTRIGNSLESSVATRAERHCKTTVSHLQIICKKLGVSLQAVAQAAWAIVLACRAQELEVIFGVVLACRDSDEAASIMFPTMNTIPMRIAIHGTAQDFIRYVQDVVNELRPFQRTPLRVIQGAGANSSQNGTASRGLFDSLFIFQQQAEESSASGVPLYESVDGESSVEYPVAAELEAVGDKLVARIACKLGDEEAHRLLEDFDHVIVHLMASPLESVARFSGKGVALCELSAFSPQDHPFAQQSPINDSSEASEEDSDDESSLALSIRTVLARVAKIDLSQVSQNTSIESLGIDSITAIKLSALLRKESVNLPVSALLKAQTPRRMAERAVSKEVATPRQSSDEIISNVLRGVDVSDVLAKAGVEADNVEGILPTSAGQQYMLSMWRKSEGRLFFPTFTYLLRTDKPVGELRAAWERLISLNPILRTVFACHDESIFQVVCKTAPGQFQEGSDLEEGAITQPMVRLVALPVGDGFQLKLRIHHALYDAVSLPLLTRDLQALLNQSQLSHAQPAFKDFLALTLTGEESRSTFWKKYLHGVQPMHLRRPRKTATRKVEVFKSSLLNPVSQINEFARASRVTVQAVFFAIYAKLYTSHAVDSAGGDDVVFGIYLANRSHLSDLESLAAPTLNLVPLVVRSPAQASLLDSARQIDSDLRSIGSAENSGVSLSEIERWTGIHVDSFVNFLKLPEQNDDSDSGADIDRIHDMNNSWEHDRSTVVDNEPLHDFQLPKELSGMPLTEAYSHAVDVEISLSSDGVSMGVFCLEDMLGLEEVESLMSKMAEELRAFR